VKICIHCKIEKDIFNFYSNGSTKIRSECKDCTKARPKATTYNVPLSFLEEMWERQDKGCAICHKKSSMIRLSVDHDHKCCPYDKNSKKCGKCVRGLLCNSCNTGIGVLQENVEILDRAAKYLLEFENVLGM
jgi:hypothetical protein